MSENRVLVHVRFAPDGTVTEIGERPASVDPQKWFDRLSLSYGMAYQSLSGGRGVFRLDRAQIDTVKAASFN